MLAAVYLYNRTLHSSTGKSPFEARYSDQPNLSHIRIWGSLAYSRLPSPSKLDPKAQQMVLVGYGKNQYKVLDQASGKTSWTRDIHIIEDQYGFTQDSEQDYDGITLLDPTCDHAPLG